MKRVVINVSNKVFLTLVLMFIVVVLGVSVYAYGTSEPAVFGHSAGEIEGGISSGFCVFSDTQTSCPSGWSQNADFNGRTLKGDASSIGINGGSDSHTHTTGDYKLEIAEMPSHTHLMTGTGSNNAGASNFESNDGRQAGFSKNTGATGGNAAHNHGNTGGSDSWSPYRTVLICCKD